MKKKRKQVRSKTTKSGSGRKGRVVGAQSPPEQLTPNPVPASVSSAWERLKAQPVEQVVPEEPVHRTEAGPGLWHRQVIPGKCTCDGQKLENGERLNPWVYGHATWCSMFIAKCDDCGMSSGTHTMECSFWTLHPTLSPF